MIQKLNLSPGHIRTRWTGLWPLVVLLALRTSHSALRTGLWPLLVLLASFVSAAAGEYLNNAELAQRLRQLQAQQPSLVRVTSLAQSLGRQEIWLVELGRGEEPERRTRPAMLAVAGLEGNDLVGTMSLVAWIEQLIEEYPTKESIRKLLDTTMLYVFPRLNPDAAAAFFASPKQEVLVNRHPADEDHDGFVDEDGPEDLNGDGLITWMRIEDPEGDYLIDPVDSRLLLKADKAKGEVGAWRLLSEGRDQDHDEAWNEDSVGGVNLNRNLPYNYAYFAAGSGVYPVSEVETRSLADFTIRHRQIGLVFTFGAVDNLLQTPAAESRGEGGAAAPSAPRGRRPATTLQANDLPYYRELGRMFRETLGLKTELKSGAEPGTFSDWMYFHRGVLSLATRPWSPALQLELAKAVKPKDEAKEKSADKKAEDKKAEDKKTEDKKPEDKRNEEERAFLKWVQEQAPAAFVSWQRFDHPDFPGKKVEIGGFAPFAKSVPPESVLTNLTSKHARFLTQLAGKLPRVAIRQAKMKALGNAVYEVVLQVENTGYLPTSLTQGQVTNEVLPSRVVLDLEEAAFLSGTRTTSLGSIDGSGGMREVRYMVHAKDRDSIQFKVISALGGSVQQTYRLNSSEP